MATPNVRLARYIDPRKWEYPGEPRDVKGLIPVSDWYKPRMGNGNATYKRSLRNLMTSSFEVSIILTVK